MSRGRQVGETLTELESAGGRRLEKGKQLALPHVVEEFLSLLMHPPDGYGSMSAKKQAEIDREILGFAKAQEKLREFIALGGNDAIADLADVRDDRQPRPQIMGKMRVWLG